MAAPPPETLNKCDRALIIDVIASAKQEIAGALTRPLALLVEDEPLIALDVEQTLSEAGFDVAWLQTCQQIDEWLKVHSPSLIVIEPTLRDGSCLQAAGYLISQGVPVIVHSGGDKSEIKAVFQAGVWLSKPTDPQILADTARRLFQPTG